MPEKLVQEILSIDRKTEDMAESVFKDPTLRKQFESESKTMEDRLIYLADELERNDIPLRVNRVEHRGLLRLFEQVRNVLLLWRHLWKMVLALGTSRVHSLIPSPGL